MFLFIPSLNHIVNLKTHLLIPLALIIILLFSLNNLPFTFYCLFFIKLFIINHQYDHPQLNIVLF